MKKAWPKLANTNIHSAAELIKREINDTAQILIDAIKQNRSIPYKNIINNYTHLLILLENLALISKEDIALKTIQDIQNQIYNKIFIMIDSKESEKDKIAVIIDCLDQLSKGSYNSIKLPFSTHIAPCFTKIKEALTAHPTVFDFTNYTKMRM